MAACPVVQCCNQCLWVFTCHCYISCIYLSCYYWTLLLLCYYCWVTRVWLTNVPKVCIISCVFSDMFFVFVCLYMFCFFSLACLLPIPLSLQIPSIDSILMFDSTVIILMLPLYDVIDSIQYSRCSTFFFSPFCMIFYFIFNFFALFGIIWRNMNYLIVRSFDPFFRYFWKRKQIEWKWCNGFFVCFSALFFRRKCIMCSLFIYLTLFFLLFAFFSILSFGVITNPPSFSCMNEWSNIGSCSYFALLPNRKQSWAPFDK